VAGKWAEETKRIMVQDWKCNEDCINTTEWSHVNPVDFARGRCDCKPPISPGVEEFEVVDWSANDFFTVSMTEWMNIHEKN